MEAEIIYQPQEISYTHLAQERQARMPVLLGKVALIAGATFVAYLPSLHGGFVLDDDLYVTANDIVKSPDGLYRFWCTTELADYYPITNTTLWLEWRLWGMNPAGYRAVNLLLHVAECLLIWLILQKLSIPVRLLGGADLRRASGERRVGRLDRPAERTAGDVLLPALDLVLYQGLPWKTPLSFRERGRG